MTWLIAMMNLIAIASGGALGALSRHGLSVVLTRHAFNYPYWSIMTINLMGCFTIGLLSLLLLEWRSHDNWTLFLITGFLGSFTTYSTFALNSVSLLEKQQFVTLLTYLFVHLIAGIALCLLGMWVAKSWLI